MTKNIGRVLMLGFLSVAAGATPGHALSICAGSRVVDLKQDACVKRATAVMRRQFKDVQPDGESIFAFGHDAAAVIICQTEQGVVFFTSSSTNSKVCHATFERLTGGF